MKNPRVLSLAPIHERVSGKSKFYLLISPPPRVGTRDSPSPCGEGEEPQVQGVRFIRILTHRHIAAPLSTWERGWGEGYYLN